MVSFVLFPSSFRCKIRAVCLRFFLSLEVWACITIKFSLRIAFAVYHRFFFLCVFPFSLSSSILFPLISSITPGLCMAYVYPTCVFVSCTYTVSLPLAKALRETDLYKQRQRMETEGEIKGSVSTWKSSCQCQEKP